MFGFLKAKPAPKPARQAAPQQLEIDSGDEGIGVIDVQLFFDRFGSVRISVRPEGVVRVRAPKGTSLDYVREVVLARAQWIAGHLERFRAQRPQRCLQYVQGEVHSFLGREYRLELRPVPGGAVGPRGVRLEGGQLVVPLREPEPERVRRLLDAWYLAQAREVFTRTIRGLVPRFDALGVPRLSQLKVRAMTSRWGTCSRSGVVTLNRHLVKASPECIEFVVAHELCHLRHHGHDAKFYALLSSVLPDWKQRRARLRQEVVL
jgi:predicted metal-dependent hydrolase